MLKAFADSICVIWLVHIAFVSRHALTYLYDTFLTLTRQGAIGLIVSLEMKAIKLGAVTDKVRQVHCYDLYNTFADEHTAMGYRR